LELEGSAHLKRSILGIFAKEKRFLSLKKKTSFFVNLDGESQEKGLRGNIKDEVTQKEERQD
jgi:hypothetical protein